MDLADCRLSDTEALSDLTLKHSPLQRADLVDISLCELRRALRLALNVRAVRDLIGVIAADRVPTKMGGMHASQMTMSAAMGGLHVVRWRRPFDDLAHRAGGATLDSIDRNPSIAFAVSAERPQQAVGASVIGVGLQPFQPRSWGDAGRGGGLWVAEAKEAVVVQLAISTNGVVPVASLNNATMTPNCWIGVRIAVSDKALIVHPAQTPTEFPALVAAFDLAYRSGSHSLIPP